jgi:hypothetical protein
MMAWLMACLMADGLGHQPRPAEAGGGVRQAITLSMVACLRCL